MFSSTVTRQCADVEILEDPTVENDETVLLVASVVGSPPMVSIGSTGTSTVTIIDDDRE